MKFRIIATLFAILILIMLAAAIGNGNNSEIEEQTVEEIQ
jgi:hypothetical protein